MEKVLISINSNLQAIGIILFYIGAVQTANLFFKGSNRDFALRKIYESLEKLLDKLK